MTDYLGEIHNFFTTRNLQLYPAKSAATLFTTYIEEVNLNLGVVVDGAQIPTIYQPINNPFTALPLKKRTNFEVNKILKAPTDSTKGIDRETFVATYNTIDWAVVNYAALVWSVSLSDTQYRIIQSCQNDA